MTTAVLVGASVAPAVADAPGTTYYVDADKGSDANSGTTPSTAVKSLERASALDLGPGDSLLFERGDQWRGQLVLENIAGSVDSPITVGSYGSADRRPVIHGTSPDYARSYATVELLNSEHVTLEGLELTNRSERRSIEGGGGGLRQGINIAVTDADRSVYSGIHVSDVDIYDVDGKTDPAGDSNDGKRTGGIGFLIDDDFDGEPVRFHDISVTDSRIERVDQTGIWLESTFRDKELQPGTEGTTRAGHTWDEIKFTDVNIGYNAILDVGKNAAILRMMEGGSFHHNVVANNADRVLAGNTVFTSYVNGAVVEWNQVGHNVAHAAKDGAAFDPDLDSPNTVWRYNYSHDNNYGLMTLCTRARDGGIEVYQNIEIGGRGRTMNINYSFSDLTVRDNAFWAKPVADVEYPDTHPEYVNPDRAQADGYPQLIWETYLRPEAEFVHGQRYTYTGNTIYNEAPTATFYLNPNEPGVSQQLVDRTVVDNDFYGIWPQDGTGAPVEDGFTHGGSTPPASWIADTVGQQVYDFWAPSIAGQANDAIGPRSGTFAELPKRPEEPVVTPGELLSRLDTVAYSLREADGNTHFTASATKAAEWGRTARWDDPVAQFLVARESFEGSTPVKQYKKGELYRYAVTDEQGAAARADGFSYNTNVFHVLAEPVEGSRPVHLLTNRARYSLAAEGRLLTAEIAAGWQDLGVLFHTASLPEVTPAPVTWTDASGSSSDTYTVPVTEHVTYLLDGAPVAAGTYPGAETVVITAVPGAGYLLADGAAAGWTIGFSDGRWVTPAEVKLIDVPGTANDAIIVPKATGVEYLLDGQVVRQGRHTVGSAGTVRVEARALAGYVVAPGAAGVWTYEFSSSHPRDK
ncbi:hypothetical protein FE374_15215 [Georgenia yuyongxinii]|uniref:Right-handed parallel beta-helix repeat-containing protein n=1 Tax=Georgenia yuyongxinii TaxID=2589797 RepID=A0A5B8C6M4_9MICO|nr:hypothetical protein [Georgenia yuyongxinii]QDC25780.1 hypothetical protein FE374_15215 [Georgenia yuyongxinii]